MDSRGQVFNLGPRTGVVEAGVEGVIQGNWASVFFRIFNHLHGCTRARTYKVILLKIRTLNNLLNF